MKYCLFFCFSFTSFLYSFAQQQTAAQMQETAKSQMQQGEFDNALLLLNRARQQEPNNIEILKDLSFTYYLKRDFASGIEFGKVLIEKPGADQQSFQILGLSYKAIASYVECAKLYKGALTKFPNSGLLYNEYAEMRASENNLEEAILLWEKGIESDPVYSGNYFNATMYYMRVKKWLRATLYGETFLNLESYSTRTDEIKTQLFVAYQNLLAPSVIEQLLQSKTISAFEKALLESLAKSTGKLQNMVKIENIISIRTLFILQWLQGKQKLYPFRLFDHQQFLLNNGLFEAYNYWLFSTTLNADVYTIWQKTHGKEFEGFKNFQEGRVFKLPVGQYYFSR